MGNFLLPRPGVPLGPGAVGPAGAYGVPGTVPYPVPNQAQSAPPNTGVSVVAGISDFLTNYRRGREAEQDRNKQEFFQDVQSMMLGIPVDHAKMAKKAKLAGLDLDFEGTNVSTQPGMPQATPPGAAPVQSPGGPTDQGLQQLLMSQATGAPRLAGPPQQPGIMSRIGQGLGLTPGPINPGSPGMAWLDQLAQTGQETSRQSQTDLAQSGQMQQVRAGMIDLLTRALKGDPMALELATRLPAPFGLKEHSLDDLRSLGMTMGADPAATAKAIMFHALGGQQAIQHMQQMAQHFSQYFGGDLGAAQKYVMDITNTGHSDLKPQMSLDQHRHMMDTVDRMAKLYPKAPLNLLMVGANLEVAGQKKASSDIFSYLSKNYQREGSIQAEQFNITNEWHQSELKQAAWIHGENINLARQQALLGAAGEEGKRAWELINGKDSTPETKLVGYKMLADSISRAGEVDITFVGANGKKKTVPFSTKGITEQNVGRIFSEWAPFGGVPALKMKNPGDALGQPPKDLNGQVWDHAMKGIRQFVEDQILTPLANDTPMLAGSPDQND